MPEETKPAGGNADNGSGDPKNGAGVPDNSGAGAKENIDSKIQAAVQAELAKAQQAYESKLAEKDKKIHDLNEENKSKRFESKSKEEREQILAKELEDEKSRIKEIERKAIENENAFKAAQIEKENLKKIVDDIKAKETLQAEKEAKEKDELLKDAEKFAKKDPDILVIAKNLPLNELKIYLNKFKSQSKPDTHNTYNPSGIDSNEPGMDFNKLDKSPDEFMGNLVQLYQEEPEKLDELLSGKPWYVGKK